jgi:uncharacterized membrane protein YfhO
VLPRAFIVDNAIVKKNESEIFQALEDPAFNLSSTIVLEKEIPSLNYLNLSSSNYTELKYTADITNYTSNYILINATLNKPGLLVLTDSYYPGWNVAVDGKSEEILAADYLFRAVYLDAGTHRIEYTYEPFSFTLGLWICALTLLGIVVAFILIYKRR